MYPFENEMDTKCNGSPEQQRVNICGRQIDGT